MPTQSLVLRGQINRRLTISEMDGNFTYLENLAQSSDNSLEEGYILLGSGVGNPATGSNNLTFDKFCKNLISGENNSISDSDSSSIIGGYGNTINGDGEGNFNVTIVGGSYNSLYCGSDYSSIIGIIHNVFFKSGKDLLNTL